MTSISWDSLDVNDQMLHIKMRASELRKKDKKELEKSVHDFRKKLSDIRFNSSSNKLKNVREIGNMKRDIARMLTIVNEKFKNQNVK